jgi:erythronate-4-phosphate dehydrogenase
VLKRGGLAACVLDVWENEPMIDEELLRRVDLGTPHIAGYSADGKANGTSMSVNAVSTFFGLGIDPWFPSDVPPPSVPEITIDCQHLHKQDVVKLAINHTYDIRSDDERLRMSVHSFEKQRADYPLRREFTSYTVRLLNPSGGVQRALLSLGFKL